MINDIYEVLIKQAKYALNSKSRDLTFQTYGEAKMARIMCAITHEQYMQLNEILIKNGINNPEVWSE